MIGTVSAINPDHRVDKTIPVGKGPVAVAIDSANGEIYVDNYNDNTVSIIDNILGYPKAIVNTISVGNGPSAITYYSDKDEMYVTNARF